MTQSATPHSSPPEDRGATAENRFALPRWLTRTLTIVLLVVTVFSISVISMIALRHIDDDYQINHVAGAWLALTKYAEHGVFCPPLYDEQTGRYGGTRFMPGRILLNLAASRVTGEYTYSAKVVSLLCTAALFITALLVMRRYACPWLPTVALGIVPIVTVPGIEAFASVRGDALPVALQLIALLVFVHPNRHIGHVVPAAVLCVLAVFCKISAIWAAGAIGLWLLATDRRLFAWFAATYIVLQCVMWSALYFATDGRVFENLFYLSASELSVGRLLALSPPKVLWMLTHQPAAWLILPLAVFSVIAAIVQRHFNPVQLAAILACLTTWIIMADEGTSENHLIDVIVLMAIVVSQTWLLARTSHDLRAMPQVVVLAVSIGLGGGILSHFRDEVAGLLPAISGRHQPESAETSLTNVLAPDDTIITDDPYVEVMRDRLPIVLDAFMLRRLNMLRPDDVKPLIERIKQQRFDAIVLLRKLDPNDDWYRGSHFGVQIARTMDEFYTLDKNVRGYWIYRPRSRQPETSEQQHE